MPENNDANTGKSAGKNTEQAAGEGKVQGEGDYIAGRRFQDAERSFAATGPVEKKAREAAAALDGPEGEELERARLESGEGKIPHKHADAEHGAAADPHTEKNLDQGLDETFPASDPVSISPGAD
jgi:hypothetical protein